MIEVMDFDPASMSVREIYFKLVQLITPRPIAWVSTLSQSGVPNLAPYSFFNGVSANPPSVMFAPVNRRDGTKKDSLINIEANGQFVVNIVSFANRESMNQSSADYDIEVNEFESCGLTAMGSLHVRPPRVAEAPAALECELIQTIHLGTGPLGGNLVIGRVLAMHIDDRVLNDKGDVDPALIDTIGRLGGSGYSRTTDRFEMSRPATPPPKH